MRQTQHPSLPLVVPSVVQGMSQAFGQRARGPYPLGFEGEPYVDI